MCSSCTVKCSSPESSIFIYLPSKTLVVQTQVSQKKNGDNGYSELSWSGVNIFVFQKETRSRAEPSAQKKSNVAVNIERCDEAMQRLKSSSRNLL